METYTVRDLRDRTSELIRGAEEGHLAVITKHGQPVFVAVPFDETLLREGVGTALAIHLFRDEKAGLAQAARIAGVSASEMMDILTAHKVPLVKYSADELADELGQFSK